MARAVLNIGLGQSTHPARPDAGLACGPRPAPSRRIHPAQIDLHKPIAALTIATVFMAGVFVGILIVGGAVLGWW